MTQWLTQIGELPTTMLMGVLGVVMLFDAIPLLGVLVPGDVAVLAAVGVGQPAATFASFTAVVLGCLAGWSVSFLVGRHFGGRLRASRVGDWIGQDRWAAAEGILHAGGGRMVLVAPFLPVFNALLPLAAGGLRMSYRRFLACAASGAALWAGLYVLLGSLARSLGGLLPDGSATWGTLGFGMIFGLVVLFASRRRLRAAAVAGSAA
ncbi:DedA family protein [Micromonospora cathayae]|uniref:VTT domain-containing protein n=1 Tax=Micromonospora cathayae TaxID=3028804 RepID=A0ABY7ZQT9_9ACTN|nr:VTT domain-containing protein [Micromonospora sp. HUAS 3]WDZ84234.1 VTT domain-containing protein [Micromonospora sp. HUAS 3]